MADEGIQVFLKLLGNFERLNNDLNIKMQRFIRWKSKDKS